MPTYYVAIDDLFPVEAETRTDAEAQLREQFKNMTDEETDDLRAKVVDVADDVEVTGE